MSLIFIRYLDFTCACLFKHTEFRHKIRQIISELIYKL